MREYWPYELHTPYSYLKIIIDSKKCQIQWINYDVELGESPRKIDSVHGDVRLYSSMITEYPHNGVYSKFKFSSDLFHRIVQLEREKSVETWKVWWELEKC